MNTILKTIIDLDYLNGNKTFNSDEIGSIISDFEQPFGTQEKINVVFSAASTSEFVPLVKISDHDVIFQFQVDLHIMNPYDSTVDAMIFKIMCYAYMSFTIDPEDFKLQLQVDNLKADFIEIDSYYKSKTTKQNMNDRVNFIKDLAVAYVNAYYLQKEIEIPYSNIFKEYIKNPTVHSRSGYLLIDADADLDKNQSVLKFLN